MLSLKDGEKLVMLARKSIRSQFYNEDVKISDITKKKFSEKQGVFVTLNMHGELRGCIGYPEPVLPLYEAIVEAAKSAAFHDPRFASLTKEEFESITIEISVLTKPEQIKVLKADDYLKYVKIGEDGLIAQAGFHNRGLLLPQVFTEYEADPEMALSMTCQKAGLSSDAWRNLDVKVFKFQAQIFAEEDGKVVEKKI
ncbi:MAG: TIGR00296 family protein [Candidatus Woesearchaeota archaeon]|nr:TIGR00296 family protein [Candidatus Woesearchaeota archaeon]